MAPVKNGKKNRTGSLPVLTLLAFFAILVGLDLVMRAEYEGLRAVLSPDSSALRFTLCWAAGLTGFVCLLPDLLRRVAMPLLTVFWCLVCVIHAVIRHLTGSFFSVR